MVGDPIIEGKSTEDHVDIQVRNVIVDTNVYEFENYAGTIERLENMTGKMEYEYFWRYGAPYTGAPSIGPDWNHLEDISRDSFEEGTNISIEIPTDVAEKFAGCNMMCAVFHYRVRPEYQTSWLDYHGNVEETRIDSVAPFIDTIILAVPVNAEITEEKEIVVDSEAKPQPQPKENEDILVEDDIDNEGDGKNIEDTDTGNNKEIGNDTDDEDWRYQDGGEIDSGIVNGWDSVKDALGVLGGLAAGIAGLAMGLGGIGSAAGGATGVEQQNPAESPGNTAVEPKKAESLKKVQKMLGTDSTDPKELMELYKQRQIDEIKSGTEEGIWGDYMEQFEKYFEKVSDSADKASTVIAAFTGEVGSDMANNLGALKAGLVRMEEDLVNDKGFFTSIKNGIVEGGVTYAQNNVNGLLTRILAYGFGEGIKANTNGESFSKAVGNGLVGSYVDSTIDNIYGELGSQIKNGTMNYRDREAFGDATDFIVSQMGEDAKGKVGELVKQRLENAADYVGNTLTYGMIRTVEAVDKSTRYVAGLFRSIFKS